MLTMTQLMEMLGMQASMNSKVNPRWGEARYPQPVDAAVN